MSWFCSTCSPLLVWGGGVVEHGLRLLHPRPPRPPTSRLQHLFALFGAKLQRQSAAALLHKNLLSLPHLVQLELQRWFFNGLERRELYVKQRWKLLAYGTEARCTAQGCGPRPASLRLLKSGPGMLKQVSVNVFLLQAELLGIEEGLLLANDSLSFLRIFSASAAR